MNKTAQRVTYRKTNQLTPNPFSSKWHVFAIRWNPLTINNFVGQR